MMRLVAGSRFLMRGCAVSHDQGIKGCRDARPEVQARQRVTEHPVKNPGAGELFAGVRRAMGSGGRG